MTESFEYRDLVNGATNGQVSKLKLDAADYDAVYSYTYDDNGNITSVESGGYKTTYTYDSLNQLVREDNEEQGKTWTWAYDRAGNILSRSEYAYTTGALGEVVDTVSYTYGDLEWRDLLTGYDGQTITHDAIGNPLEVKDSAGNVVTSYTWEHGRQLASMTTNGSTWTYTYDANGMRTGKTNGTATYSYVYNGSQLSQMKMTSSSASYEFKFTYDASGTPLTVTMDDEIFYYVTNLQGDVVALLEADGSVAAEYSYSAYGTVHITMGHMISFFNPLLYRGYVADLETGLYYLQSRYYNPTMGRFINADTYISNGQGFAGMNMFAYCINNPVNGCDPCGTCFHRWDFWNDCEKCGGKTIGDKVNDGINKIKNHHRQQIEVQNEVSRMQVKLIHDTAKKGIEQYANQIQMQAEAQYQQDMRIIKVGKYLANDPKKAVDVAFAAVSVSVLYIGYLAFVGVTIPTVVKVATDILGNASTAWGVYRIIEELYDVAYS